MQVQFEWLRYHFLFVFLKSCWVMSGTLMGTHLRNIELTLKVFVLPENASTCKSGAFYNKENLSKCWGSNIMFHELQRKPICCS